ncbi:hypothetical protein DSN97_08670 [Deferribacteraceae bacterium V6Fe1]|jgi:chemotaxis signal transduction protein|uniref:hypothetical protein n=1 Tax=Deferrivibrio essentukiensis TaxID=2880922 RepID=UPI001F60D84C|nr:hypothetical protein [Deferrivibrio essentukiensis]MCB4204959.1 hypothetical protein [Deferrivibrio essentukiensis]UOD34224.1 hypothetical protein DSN97_08670 [Deferribacteraceae bacterium V6Fe1]
MEYIFLTTEIHTFCIDLLKVESVIEENSLKKFPMLEKPLISFYYHNNLIAPVYDLGMLFDEPISNIKILTALKNEQKTILLSGSKIDIIHEKNITFEKCEKASDFDFIEKNIIAKFNNNMAYILNDNIFNL